MGRYAQHQVWDGRWCVFVAFGTWEAEAISFTWCWHLDSHYGEACLLFSDCGLTFPVASLLKLFPKAVILAGCSSRNGRGSLWLCPWFLKPCSPSFPTTLNVSTSSRSESACCYWRRASSLAQLLDGSAAAFTSFQEEWKKILIPAVSWTFPSVVVWRKGITTWE